jgi:hypothetical protein
MIAIAVRVESVIMARLALPMNVHVIGERRWTSDVGLQTGRTWRLG